MSGYSSRTIASIVFALTAACTSDGSAPAGSGSAPSVVEDFCTRLDKCNKLDGSVEDCIQEIDQIFKSFTPNQVADYEDDLKTCLSYRACDNFIACALPDGGAFTVGLHDASEQTLKASD